MNRAMAALAGGGMPPADGQVADSSEMVYISSLALLKVSFSLFIFLLFLASFRSLNFPLSSSS